jgi:fatty acid desaturase
MKAERIASIAGVSTFGALGTAALAGALFFGAIHQIAIAAVCAVMTWTLWGEIRREDRKARSRNRQTS